MQQAAIELISNYYTAYNEHRFDDMLEYLDEDVRHFVNQGELRQGKELFRQFNIRMKSCYIEHVSDMIILATGDGRRAAAEFVFSGEYISNDDGLPPAYGQKYSLPGGTFFEINSGKITRITTYYNLQNWISQLIGR